MQFDVGCFKVYFLFLVLFEDNVHNRSPVCENLNTAPPPIPPSSVPLCQFSSRIQGDAWCVGCLTSILGPIPPQLNSEAHQCLTITEILRTAHVIVCRSVWTVPPSPLCSPLTYRPFRLVPPTQRITHPAPNTFSFGLWQVLTRV